MRSLSPARPIRVLAAALLLGCGLVQAQPRATPAALPAYRFQRLTPRDGLPENYIITLLQDSSGLLWIGTQNGLVRYDGRTMHTYRQRSASGRTGLQSVWTIAQDHRGGLWAGGGFDSGLWHLDRRTGRLTGYEHDERDAGTLSGNVVQNVTEAAPGRLVVVSSAALLSRVCLDRLDMATGRVRRLQQPGPTGIPEPACTSGFSRALRDRSGGVWVGTASGLFRYDPTADTLARLPTPGFDGYAHYPALSGVMRRARLLAAVSRPRDNEDRTVGFRLNAASPVLVVAGGELTPSSRNDYAWIEDTQGRVVWTMERSASAWMGGNGDNRLVVATPTLTAGSYRLRYRSDGAESAAKWSAPPALPHLWGVRVGIPAPADLRAVASLGTRLRPRRADELPDPRARPLVEQRDGTLWLGTDRSGPLQWHPRTGRFVELGPGAGPADVPDSLRLSRATVHDALVGAPGEVWFGTDRGLYRLAGGRATRFSFAALPTAPGNDLQQLVRARDGTLWLSTGDGAVQFDPATEAFRRYPHQRADPTALGGYGVSRLLADRQGNVWIGTAYGGLHRLDRSANRTRLFRHDPASAQSLPSNGIWSLAEAADGAIWAATDSGLARIDLRTNTVTRPPDAPRATYALASDRKGRLWATQSSTNRVLQLDARTGRLLDTFPRTSRDSAISRAGAYRRIYADADGTVWVGTGDVGLVRLNPATGAVHRYPVRRAAQAGTSDSLDQVEANQAFRDRQGFLWVGTDEGGLNRLDVRTGRFTSYFSQNRGIESVQDITEDRRGRLWFGTYLDGLFGLDPRTGAITHLTPADGLPHYHVQNIVRDDAGLLWLNTPAGVTRFDPEKKAFRTFGPGDGVPLTGVPRAALRTRDGLIVVAGNEGLLVLNPSSLAGTGTTRPLLALDALTFRTATQRDTTLGLTGVERVDLGYDATDVTFTFTGLDYARPDALRYQYRLSDAPDTTDFRAHWSDAGPEGRARFPRLPPGRFRLAVRAAGADGLWSLPSTLQVVVRPPGGARGGPMACTWRSSDSSWAAPSGGNGSV